MKTFRNVDPANFEEAAVLARNARANSQVIAFSGGGTDLLQQIKDGTEAPDVLINLRNIPGADQVQEATDGARLGGLLSLDALSQNALVRDRFTAVAMAAGAVGTPQIRNAGTLAGNVTQRPWCWYYRNGFACYKAGGNICYSAAGENQQHAIFGGGPSYIVHPSDVAPALLAMDAQFHLTGPDSQRTLAASEFFVLPAQNPRYENVLERDELLTAVSLPVPAAGTRSTYYKVTDRAAWTHAVVSAAVVLQLDGDQCLAATIVLGGVAPIPWRARAAEELLTGQRITEELAAQAGAAAVAGAQPLAKNAYKIPMTSAVVRRTVMGLI